MKIVMKSVLYDGLVVTVEGDQPTIANWLHENVLVCAPALEAGKIKDQCDRILWQHDDPQAIAAINRQLEKGSIDVYNVQDTTIGDDHFNVS